MTPKIEIVEIGPERALELLENNDHNRRIKGVIDVRPVQSEGWLQEGVTRMRIKHELRQSLIEWMGKSLS